MAIVKQTNLQFLPALLLLLLLCILTPLCTAQADAVQIVARAALCLDNRPVMNGCLQSMGINIPGFGNTSNTGTSSGTALAPSSSTLGPASAVGGPNATGMCGAPCYGQMMLMMTCVDGILSNLQGYQSGLMQGVQAIFQMSCGVTGNGNTAGGGAGGGGGGVGVGGAGIGAGTGTGTGGGLGGGAGGGQSGSTTNGGSHLATRGEGKTAATTNGMGATTTPNLRFWLIPLLLTFIHLQFSISSSSLHIPIF